MKRAVEPAEPGLAVTTETVADQLAATVRSAGVDRVFGLPGGEVLGLMDALRRCGVEFVLCRHEGDAGLMASVYGKLRGTPGVVLTTLGPGASNLLQPIASSLLEREPLLAISAEISAKWPRAHSHQRLPLVEIFRPITKFATSVQAADCVTATTQALAAAITEPMGPAFLALSADTAEQPARAHLGGSPDGDGHRQHQSQLRLRDAREIGDLIGARLKEAHRPLLIAGLGAHATDAGALRAWLSSWQLPFGVTPKAKGLVDELDPLFVGVFGGMARDDLMLEAIERADLIVGFGLDPVEIDKPWHAEAPLLWILDSPGAGGNLPDEDCLMVSHHQLLARLGTAGAPTSWPDAFGDIRLRRNEVATARYEPHETLTPVTLVRALADCMPADTTVATDVGSHKYVFGQFWPSRMPESFLMSNGLSGMGYGLPAAIGAKLARPEQHVLAVIGDGGFSMNSQELDLVARYGLAIVVIVIADQSYSLIRLAQAARGLPRLGVDFDPIDNVALAEACGVPAVRVETADELANAVGDALAGNRALVVEVPIDPEAYDGLV